MPFVTIHSAARFVKTGFNVRSLETVKKSHMIKLQNLYSITGLEQFPLFYKLRCVLRHMQPVPMNEIVHPRDVLYRRCVASRTIEIKH